MQLARYIEPLRIWASQRTNQASLFRLLGLNKAWVSLVSGGNDCPLTVRPRHLTYRSVAFLFARSISHFALLHSCCQFCCYNATTRIRVRPAIPSLRFRFSDFQIGSCYIPQFYTLTEKLRALGLVTSAVSWYSSATRSTGKG